jgi:hypothetical protein
MSPPSRFSRASRPVWLAAVTFVDLARRQSSDTDTKGVSVRNPRAEASERLEGRYEVRVLEPSPPAVQEGPWFADDPTAPGDVPADRKLVSPVSTGDVTWDALARADADLGAWCADRWLGAWRRLGEAPPSLDVSRVALHRVAEHVLKPAREAANGKIALRYTCGGFGTPFFGDDVQLRVEGVELVAQEGATERREALSTLGEAAAFAGVELADEAEPLNFAESAAAFVADWFGFAASVLEQLRAEATAELEPSRVQLWPEHFDMAVELGAESDGVRAGYGLSPGDELHAEPYVYVVPWEGSAAQGQLFGASTFQGAELPYAELLAASDQRAVALDFLRVRLRALTG